MPKKKCSVCKKFNCRTRKQCLAKHAEYRRAYYQRNYKRLIHA